MLTATCLKRTFVGVEGRGHCRVGDRHPVEGLFYHVGLGIRGSSCLDTVTEELVDRVPSYHCLSQHRRPQSTRTVLQVLSGVKSSWMSMIKLCRIIRCRKYACECIPVTNASCACSW